MASSPEQPELIRCGVCGELNPADAVTCGRCGARLRPITSPDELASKGAPTIQTARPEGSPDEDSLDVLRSQLAGEDRSKAPTGPLKELDPDFVVGGAGEAGEEGPPSEETGEVPDWLREHARPGAAAQPPASQPEEEPDEEVPDWLRELEAQPPAPAGETPLGEAVPDWLADLVGAEEEQLPAPAPAEAEAGWPGEQTEPIIAAPEAAGEPSPPGELPDWLAAFGTLAGEEAAASPTEPGEAEPSVAEGPAGEQPLPLPIIKVGRPSWLRPEDEAEPELTGEEGRGDVAPAGAEEAPPSWLAGLAGPEAAPAAEEEAPSPEPTAALESPPDWMEAFDFDEILAASVEESVAPAAEGEDLLGLSDALVAPSEAETLVGEAVPPAMEEVPDWLRGLREEKAPPAPAVEEPDRELVEQIQDLRFEAIVTSPMREQPVPETVGALKDVSGVIQPEMIFEGTSLSIPQPVEAAVITGEQLMQIGLVKKLVAREEEGVPLSGERSPGLPFARWLVALVMLVAVSLAFQPFAQGFVLPLLRPAAASPEVDAAYRLLDGLAAEQAAVLVAFEYEPDTVAELQPLAEAVLDHLAQSEDVTVYAVSTRPTGPAMAEDVLQREAIRPRLAADGGTWVNLGFLPGQANGISSLTYGSPPGVPSSLSLDYLGQPTGLQSTRLVGGAFDLIIVFAARSEDLRAWIEQAAAPTGIPVLAGLSARSAPFAQPYRQSGQLVAVLAGLNDAVAYRARDGAEAGPAVMSRWSAQVVGSVAAALLILIGGLAYGLSSSRGERVR